MTAVWIFLLTGHVLGVVSASHSATWGVARDSSRARVGALLLLPYLFVPMYWLFVLNRSMATRRSRRARPGEANSLRSQLIARREKSESEHSAFFERLGALPISRGNSVDVLVDGEETFTAIYNRLGEARNYVLVQFYLIRPDSSGRELLQRLLELARGGVRVYLLYDPLEARPPAYLLNRLKEEGVVVCEHRPPGISHCNFRNHRKVMVVDGRYAFVGGFNVGDEYLSRERKTAPWRDTHFALEGPSVTDVQLAFVEDFVLAGERAPEVDWDAYQPVAGQTESAVVCSGPYHRVGRCRHVFLQALSGARERVWIATPFFAPDDAGVAALEQAVLRGVEVLILLPQASDVALADLVAWSYIEHLLPLGVGFHRSLQGSMHQKIMLVDNDIVIAGSANYDFRSFHLNHEITLWTRDALLNKRVETMLRLDLRAGRRLGAADLNSRGRVARWKTGFARVVDLLLNG